MERVLTWPFIRVGALRYAKIMVTKPDDYSTVLLDNKPDLKHWDSDKVPVDRMSIWRQKGRLRIYINEEKVADIPRFFVELNPYMLAFYHNFYGESPC